MLKMSEISKSKACFQLLQKQQGAGACAITGRDQLTAAAGKRYMEFTTPFRIFVKISHNKKFKTKTAPLLNLCKSLLLSPFNRSRLLTPVWAHDHPSKFYVASSPQATAWEGGVGGGWGPSLRMFLPPATPLTPSQSKFISPVFWNIGYLYFITQHGLSHLPAWRGVAGGTIVPIHPRH